MVIDVVVGLLSRTLWVSVSWSAAVDVRVSCQWLAAIAFVYLAPVNAATVSSHVKPMESRLEGACVRFKHDLSFIVMRRASLTTNFRPHQLYDIAPQLHARQEADAQDTIRHFIHESISLRNPISLFDQSLVLSAEPLVFVTNSLDCRHRHPSTFTCSRSHKFMRAGTIE